MDFRSEKEFEDAIIDLLVSERGWAGGVINNPTEEDLIKNWVDIIFQMNNEVDRLNGVPLNKGEIKQLINKINGLQTPNQRNSFINDKTVTIKRENEDDPLHFGKDISLKIFDRNEIAAGSSIYQIARQPRFAKENQVDRDRRGDFTLLINGLPVIHVELKRSGVPVSKAIYQIKSYLHENKFRGLFSLIQIFVAMTPEDMRYFANPGRADLLNEDYFFYWADFNNEPTGDWKTVSSEFLSIPMAHQLIGYYTIADTKDGILKVMRSYQIYATREIVDRVRERQRDNWSIKDQYGGYIWHTTGSGKTMTSFKAAELIAQLKYSDKVVFLVDRITLATQTVLEFEGFSAYEEIFATESSETLMKTLEDDDIGRVIVTSIQKMSNLVDGMADARRLEKIKNKRIVFIVDEAHRSTFGTMMTDIKNTYQNAIFFGFTGTPIQTETNNTNSTEITTADIFGNELHHYTLADGIRDKNVLAFDITKVETIAEKELRQKYALYKANVSSLDDLKDNDKAYAIYQEYMDEDRHPSIEIETNLGNSPFENDEHRQKVVENILGSWIELNHKNELSAIFATSSIKEAILYWRMLKDNKRNLNVTCIFDASDEYNAFSIEKEDGLKDIITHYNDMFGKSYSISTHTEFKADLAKRLAQKLEYRNIDQKDKIDIVIVVYQLLTGYDSKWVSMLFLDKTLEMHNLIQAFSRTNRLNGSRKPHGTIKYYRKINTMEKNIKDAVEEYSGNNPYMMFVDKLPTNVKSMNRLFDEISEIFTLNKIENFSKIPKDEESQQKFVKCFNQLNDSLNSGLAQGFSWDKTVYYDQENKERVNLKMTEEEYNTLVIRYGEVANLGVSPGGKKPELDFDYTIIEKTSKIDYEYMNKNFEKYMKALFNTSASKEDIDSLRASLHKNFASLPKDRQVLAEMIINDLESGDLKIVKDWNFNYYINEYSISELDKQINSIVTFTGIEGDKLKKLLALKLTDKTINEFGRFDLLLKTADDDRIIENLSKLKGSSVPKYKGKIYLNKMLRQFLLEDTFDIETYNQLMKEDI